MVYENAMEDAGNDSYIAFYPAQVKSIENNGDFDPGRGKIQFSKVSGPIIEWAKPESIERAYHEDGSKMTRDEIFSHFDNTPQAVATTPGKYVTLLGEGITDSNVYCSEAYFLDHAVHHHPTTTYDEYLTLQDVIDNCDDIKEVYENGKRSVVFVKRINGERHNFAAQAVQLETTEDGKIVWHKTYFAQKKEPYKNYRSIKPLELVSEDATPRSSVLNEEHTVGKRNISTPGTEGKDTNNSGTASNSAKNSEDIRWSKTSDTITDSQAQAAAATQAAGQARTAQFARLAREKGYDGMMALETSKKVETFAVLNSNQVKSADPVTYDNQGNVIPLSERFSRMADIRWSKVSALNKEFNKNLARQAAGEDMGDNFTYDLGTPSRYLLSAGFPDLPISLRPSILNRKSNDPEHPYDIAELKDLVKAIQRPWAIFKYGKGNDARNLIVGMEHKGKQFLVGIFLNPTVNGRKLEINSVRNVFPKDNDEGIKWIQDGKHLRIDNKAQVIAKIKDLAAAIKKNQPSNDKLGIDPLVFTEEKLNSLAKDVKNFENPKINFSKTSDTITDSQAQAAAAIARDMARKLGTAEADAMIARMEEIAPDLSKIESYDNYWDFRSSEDL